MILQELIQDLGLTLQPNGGSSPAAVEIGDLTDDSRLAGPGCLFIARGGAKTDGKKFIADAIAKGALAVLSEQPAPAGVVWVSPQPGTTINHALVSRLAERFFGNPGQKLKLIGVTGTNGKTTITFVIQHLLRQAGVKAGVIGTVLIDDGAKRTAAELTTPGGVEFSRYLAAMVRHGCEAAIAEVSSHALHQGRLAGLDFSVAIFTNLTGDHLDYHGTMENYAAAKAMLFENLRPDAWAIVNADDAWSPRMLRDCRARVIRCGLAEGGLPLSEAIRKESPAASHCAATILALGASHSCVNFEGGWGSLEVKLPLVGRHNVINVLEAMAAANAVVSISRDLSEALERCPAPPGRLEPVRVEGDSSGKTRFPAVLVDYAHTHDALENVLGALRPVTRGKLTVVFGCGGDRDRTKRPKMAAVCCRLADRIIVTSDNPRTEDPNAIIDEILTGVPGEMKTAGSKALVVQPDRAAAIATAIEDAAPEDTVLIAGKGHEDYQIIGLTKRHFDDREEAVKALRKKSGI